MPKKQLFTLSLLLMFCITKTQAQDWLIKYNLTEPEYQKTFDNLNKTYYPADINVTTVNGQNRFSCIWYRQGTGSYWVDWMARHNLSLDEFKAVNDNFVQEKGLVPFSITPYVTPQKEVKYAATWQKHISTDVSFWTDVEFSEYAILLQVLKDEEYSNYMPYCSEFYTDENGVEKLLLFMVEGSSIDTEPTNTNSQNLAENIKKAKEIGYFPLYISAHNDGGKISYGVIWQENIAQYEWEINDGLSHAQLEKTKMEKEKAGYYPSILKAYELNKEAKYMVVWLKQTI